MSSSPGVGKRSQPDTRRLFVTTDLSLENQSGGSGPGVPPSVASRLFAGGPAGSQPQSDQLKDPNSISKRSPSASPTSPRVASGPRSASLTRHDGSHHHPFGDHQPSSPKSATLPRTQRRTSRQGSGIGRAFSPPNLMIERAHLQTFAAHCRAWLFDSDTAAGNKMNEILAALPQSHRAVYVRLQSYIRSSYHLHVQETARSRFLAHLSATQPGQSLPPHLRGSPRADGAQTSREERLSAFISNWSNASYAGTQPFLTSLWALCRLQSLSLSVGGAGPYRICWTMDDAVFRESAGQGFMRESIDLLKGVLGFSEDADTNRSTVSLISSAAVHVAELADTAYPASSPSANPFLDQCGHDDTMLTVEGANAFVSDAFQRPVSVIADREELRTWTAPSYLTDEHWARLSHCFPASITRVTLPRFSASQFTPSNKQEDVHGSSEADVEASDALTDRDGLDAELGDGGMQEEVLIGTGKLVRSRRLRTPGFERSLWSRLMMWFRAVFGR